MPQRIIYLIAILIRATTVGESDRWTNRISNEAILFASLTAHDITEYTKNVFNMLNTFL